MFRSVPNCSDVIRSGWKLNFEGLDKCRRHYNPETLRNLDVNANFGSWSKLYPRRCALYVASIYFLDSSDENRRAQSATERKCQFWQEVLKNGRRPCSNPPLRIRKLGFRIYCGRTETTTGSGYFGRIFGKSLTGIRCRAVDSL